MTAVAEGAAIFAESIDWASQSRNRKTSRGSLASSGSLKVTFNYTARTPSNQAKIVAQVDGEVTAGAEFQVDNLDTGWSSGRIALAHGAVTDVALSKGGENTFKVSVFDARGGALTLVLAAKGRVCLQNDDIDALRQIVGQLARIQIDHVSDIDMMEIANIIRG